MKIIFTESKDTEFSLCFAEFVRDRGSLRGTGFAEKKEYMEMADELLQESLNEAVN